MTERLPFIEQATMDAYYEGFGGAIMNSPRPSEKVFQPEASSLEQVRSWEDNKMYDQQDIIASERMAGGE